MRRRALPVSATLKNAQPSPGGGSRRAGSGGVIDDRDRGAGGDGLREEAMAIEVLAAEGEERHGLW